MTVTSQYSEETSYWILGNRGSIHGKDRELPFWTASKPAQHPTQTPILWVLGTLCLWPDRLGYEAYLSCLDSLHLPTNSLFGNIMGYMRKNFSTKSKRKRKLWDLDVDGNIFLKWILYMVYGFILDSTGLGLECVVILCSSGVPLKDGNFSTS